MKKIIAILAAGYLAIEVIATQVVAGPVSDFVNTTFTTTGGAL